jgi:hypothetical protein
MRTCMLQSALDRFACIVDFGMERSGIDGRREGPPSKKCLKRLQGVRKSVRAIGRWGQSIDDGCRLFDVLFRGSEKSVALARQFFDESGNLVKLEPQRFYRGLGEGVSAKTRRRHMEDTSKT